jgi:hypothetical protein
MFNPTGLGWLDWHTGITFHYAGTWNDIDLVVRACGDAVTSRTLFDELFLPGATDEDPYNWNGQAGELRSYPSQNPGDLVEDASDTADSYSCYLYSQQEDTWDVATQAFPTVDDWADHCFMWMVLEMAMKNAGLEHYRDTSKDWSYGGRQWQVPF